MLYRFLKWVYHRHTEKDILCCPETCWCWDLDNIILKIEMRKDKKGKLGQ